MKKKNLIIIFVILLVIVLAGVGIFAWKREDKKETDAKRFSEEYSMVGEENPFVYRSLSEIIKILENGTGIVYLGFPECPWCNHYVAYLNEIAGEKNVDKIYYANILNDRKENTEEYQKVVKILSDYLQYDAEGNKRIYVPSLIIVEKGKILAFDDETAYDTKGHKTPEEYWEKEDLKGFKEKIKKMLSLVSNNVCTDCNL